MISCMSDCGAVFHKCKTDDHRLFCPNAQVPCINAYYGCPAMISQRDMAKHLPVCPASVVYCTAEWNRWPVYCTEKRSRVPFNQSSYHAKYDQLDVALALRDQRLLNEAEQVPKNVLKVLRNPLTRRFPAVPLITKASSFDPNHSPEDDTLSDSSEEALDLDAPWEKSKNPPGLSSSVCNELFKTTEISNCYPTNGPKTTESQQVNDCNLVENAEVESITNAGDASAEDIPAPPASPPPLKLQELLALDINLEMMTRYQAKPRSMYTFLCSQQFRRDQYTSHFQNVHDDIHPGLGGWLEHRCPLAQYGCTYTRRRFYPTKPGACVVFSPLLESFGIQAEFDQYNDYAQQRKSILTKEYTPEVLTPINGKGSIQINGTCLHRESSAPRHSPSPSILEDRFTILPFEVLQYLTQFLDSFSLCNVALTCKKLREVCCSILERRGVVIQEWQQSKENGQVKWKVAYLRWFLTSAFTPVDHWGFIDQPHLSDHLRTCPFYFRQPQRDGPMKLHMAGPSPTNPGFYKPLQRMYPNHDFNWSPEYLAHLDELANEQVNDVEDCDDSDE